MDGLRKLAIGDSSVIVLESVTDDIKQTLREQFANYCYGRVRAGESPDYYSFELTVEQFFRLYDTKAHSTRMGLAGELVVHLLLSDGHENLESACVYLNKEEHSVKKGFDLTFLDREDGDIWYGEVKSGDVSDGSNANEKAWERIGEAERSLEQMFTTNIEKKRWDAAQFDADSALRKKRANKVKDLLRTDFMEIHRGATKKVRALLCAVVMHPFESSQIDAETGAAILERVRGRGRFRDVRLFLIQQSDLGALVRVLREALSGVD